MPVIGTNGIEFGKFDVPLMIALGVERIAVVVPFGCKKMSERSWGQHHMGQCKYFQRKSFADEVRELRSGTSPKEATHLKRPYRWNGAGTNGWRSLSHVVGADSWLALARQE